MQLSIEYHIEEQLSAQEFQSILVASTLGKRRPVNDIDRLEQMLLQADLIITARLEDRLIGVARSISDFAYCTYLSDLAVDADYQKRGIGRELIRRTKLAAPQAKLILLSAPAAIPYYPRIGMTKFEHCFFLDDAGDLK